MKAKRIWFHLCRLYPLKDRVNLGGGPNFFGLRWHNFDGAQGRYNKTPFFFTKDTRIPLEDKSIRLVYSSHFLEHVDIDTATNVLSEARRILRRGGHLVLKIPDYDAALKAWSDKDQAFFSDRNWAFHTVNFTWPRKGMPDTIDARAAMLFCGYWTKDFGDHFSDGARTSSGYQGPPDLTDIHELLSLESPFEIARKLRRRALDECPDLSFSHQTAWSRAEFFNFVESCGFAVESADRDTICEGYKHIPGINQMRDISLYVAARVTR